MHVARIINGPARYSTVSEQLKKRSGVVGSPRVSYPMEMIIMSNSESLSLRYMYHMTVIPIPLSDSKGI